MGQRFVVRKDDSTTTGGQVLAGSPDLIIGHRLAARRNDPVRCPRCGSVGLIAEGNPTWLANGEPVAGHDHVVSCGCPPGSHRLIASQTHTLMAEESVGLDWQPPGEMASGVHLRFPSLEALQAFQQLELDGQAVRVATDQEEPEEEDEEEELDETPGLTLRLAAFFDGTGNNLANAALTERCRQDDRQQLGEETLLDTIAICERFGFSAPDEHGVFQSHPNDSYGNAPSNVALLSELYLDNTSIPLEPDATIGYVPIYIEGIGTTSGAPDSRVSQATGRGETGVLQRVIQSPAAIKDQLLLFVRTNPGIHVARLEFDLFGFSRGAAAARHFANEVLKPDGGILGEVLKPGQFGLQADFDWSTDVCINFIGLFDTVAAIVDPLRGDWSPANDLNPGINLYLPPGCARKVVQLTAADEYRWNFPLTSVAPHHQEISLPGAHSDIGGGYPALMQEKLLLSRPRATRVSPNMPLERSSVWREAQLEVARLELDGLPGDGQMEPVGWHFPNANEHDVSQRALVAIAIQRRVRGELSRVALRVMRELALQHGVPVDILNAEDRRFEIPGELHPIATKILAYAQGAPLHLSKEDNRLLRTRYIHLSAHWTPSSGVMVNKPAPNRRLSYSNKPQQGYPE